MQRRECKFISPSEMEYNRWKADTNFKHHVATIEKKKPETIVKALLEIRTQLDMLDRTDIALTRVQFRALEKAIKTIDNVIDKERIC